MRAESLVLVLGLALTPLGCSESSPTPAATSQAARAAAGKTAASAPGKAASPIAPGGTPGAAPAASGPTAPTPPQESYTYQAEGRRDPFLNLLNGGVNVPRSATQRAEGVAGLAVNEIAVRGLAQMSGTVVALVQGPDGRNYNVHQGDKLADGSVKSITPEGLVIMQDVNDPLSTAKQREVRKLLRSVEEAKP